MRSHQLAGLLVGVVAVVGSVLAVTAPASAVAAVQVPPGCGQPVASTNGHTLSLRCKSGHGKRYEISASACDSHHCETLRSSVAKYGAKATLTTGGYLTKSSLRVSWLAATGKTTCAYSLEGGTVAWCDMEQSILDWVHRHPVYDGPGLSNSYRDNTYRADCSGFVSMAWHLSDSPAPTTDTLRDSKYTKAVARKNLRPGDILDDTQHAYANHHVVIFAGWNADHHQGTTDGTFRVWSFGNTTLADDTRHHELHDAFKAGKKIRTKPVFDYTPLRFVRGAP